jgi:hypothetical protein
MRNYIKSNEDHARKEYFFLAKRTQFYYLKLLFYAYFFLLMWVFEPIYAHVNYFHGS